MSVPTAHDEPEALPLSDGSDPLVFHVSDLKQWFVCRRIVYYHYAMPAVRPTTYSMEAGTAAHAEAHKRERRRTLSAYNIPDGERHFDVLLYAPTVGLSGRVDMVIEREDECIPVDFKDSLKPTSQQFQMQVVAYGLLVEHLWARSVTRGFVYSLPKREAEEVKITQKRRAAVKRAVSEMRRHVLAGTFPSPPRNKRLCVTCEFQRFCNDVL